MKTILLFSTQTKKKQNTTQTSTTTAYFQVFPNTCQSSVHYKMLNKLEIYQNSRRITRVGPAERPRRRTQTNQQIWRKGNEGSRNWEWLLLSEELLVLVLVRLWEVLVVFCLCWFESSSWKVRVNDEMRYRIGTWVFLNSRCCDTSFRKQMLRGRISNAANLYKTLTGKWSWVYTIAVFRR